jgi:hypothetical protein
MFSVEMSIKGGKVKGHVPWIRLSWLADWLFVIIIHPIHRRLDPNHPNLEMND